MSTPDELFQKTSGPVVMAFLQDWCGHCTKLKPKLIEMSLKHKGKITFIFINGDKNPATLEKWKVSSFPQVFIYDKNKRLIQHVIGNDPDAIIEGFNKVL